MKGPQFNTSTQFLNTYQGKTLGPRTYIKAFERGMPSFTDPQNTTETSINWPRSLDFQYLNGNTNRQNHFGKFKFIDSGVGDEITWPSENILSVKPMRGGHQMEMFGFIKKPHTSFKVYLRFAKKQV